MPTINPFIWLQSGITLFSQYVSTLFPNTESFLYVGYATYRKGWARFPCMNTCMSISCPESHFVFIFHEYLTVAFFAKSVMFHVLWSEFLSNLKYWIQNKLHTLSISPSGTVLIWHNRFWSILEYLFHAYDIWLQAEIYINQSCLPPVIISNNLM